MTLLLFYFLFCRKGDDRIMSVTQSVYGGSDHMTYIHTEFGILRVINDISLGDIVIVTVLSMWLIFNVIKYVIDRIWG